MFQLDLKSGVSICDQIVNGFIRLKALGIMKGGEQLPSVRTLAMQFSVNPNTIQKAYTILEANGIVYTVKGKGCFLSDDAQSHDAILKNASLGFEAAVKSAMELGLTGEQLKNIIDEIISKKEDNV